MTPLRGKLGGGTGSTVLEADSETLRRVLREDIRVSGLDPSGPRLLVLAGLPGTGKSHFTRQLVSRVPFLVLETDRLRKILVEQPQYNLEEHRRLFQTCNLLIEHFLKEDFPVVFDATNVANRWRIPLYDIAERLAVPLAVVAVTAPRETVRRRLKGREAGCDPDTNSDAGWQIYCRMVSSWEPVDRDHFPVDTSRDIGPVLRQVVNWASTANTRQEYAR